MRHPKIYVVTEGNAGYRPLRFATVDIDDAFAFAQRAHATQSMQISELDGEGGVVRSWHSEIHPQLSSPVGVVGVGGLPVVQVRMTSGGPQVLPPLTQATAPGGRLVTVRWRQGVEGSMSAYFNDGGEPIEPYKHVPGGRKERLLEAAEVIMTMAITEEAT